MKLSTLLMLMAALQFTLMMFGESYSETPVWLLVTTPFDWSTNSFINFFQLLSGVALVGAAIVGTLVFGKNDLAVFGGVVAVFVGCCVPISTLWVVINKEVGYFGTQCPANGGICSSALVASLICAPLAILSLITIINWWRSASDIS